MSVEQIKFGHGSFVGAVMLPGSGFFDLDSGNQARVLGYADACPVVEELIDPGNTALGRGPDAMVDRYGEVNFWFGEIGRVVAEVNPALYQQLMTPVRRLTDEPIGKYEPESVPESNLTEMAPMGTLAGYALPRVFVEQLQRTEDQDLATHQERLIMALDKLEVAAIYATTPLELLAFFGEGLAGRGQLEASKVLKHALSQGWLEEHNGHTMIDDFKVILGTYTFKLSDFYNGLSEQGKAELKLA